jgi:hypothetical protein
MSNFSENVKLFYSQGYTEVYDNGALLDVKSLYPSQTWDFCIHGLEDFQAEEVYFEDLGYSFKHYFNLEDVGKYIWDLDIQSKSEYPQSIWYSYDFYHENLDEADIGCVYTFGVTIENKKTFAVRSTTDGSHGWLEVFDNDGNIVGAARTLYSFKVSKIAWCSPAWIRNNFPAYPSEIDYKV